MEKFIFKNQELLEERQVNLSINDRGFLFGDGVFETCKIFNGTIYDFASHYNRLQSSLKSLKIAADISTIQQQSLELIAKNAVKNGILKINITRGSGSFGYAPSNEATPLIIIQTLEERPIPDNISLGLSDIRPPLNAFGKSTNSLPYVMNKITAQEAGLFDCVMLSENNFICETSSANIFWVKDGAIFTPSLSCNILDGTLRKRLMALSPIKIVEIEADLSAIEDADEIFLTNSSFLILPVDVFLGRRLSQNIGSKLAKLMQEDLITSCKN